MKRLGQALALPSGLICQKRGHLPVLAQTAQVLSKEEEAEEYRRLSQQITEAYVRAFVGPNGRINPDKQASYEVGSGTYTFTSHHAAATQVT